MSESKVVLKPSENAPMEPTILRNAEQSIIMRHPSKHSWEHLCEVVARAQKEALTEFQDVCAGMPREHTVAYEPFSVTISLWRKGRMLKKASDKLIPVFERHFDEQAEQVLAKLPKLFWTLKKTHTGGKADTLMIAFEWLTTVDAAPAKAVAAMVVKAAKERDEQASKPNV